MRNRGAIKWESRFCRLNFMQVSKMRATIPSISLFALGVLVVCIPEKSWVYCSILKLNTNFFNIRETKGIATKTPEEGQFDDDFDLDAGASDLKSSWENASPFLSDPLTLISTTTTTESSTSLSRKQETEESSTSSPSSLKLKRRRRRKPKRKIDRIKSLTYIDSPVTSSPSTTTTVASSSTTMNSSTLMSSLFTDKSWPKETTLELDDDDKKYSFSYALPSSAYLFPNQESLEREESSSMIQQHPSHLSVMHPPSFVSMFDPLMHPTGHLLPPPFMTAPFMQHIPSLVPPTHPIYLLHLPKPPIAAPYDPLLIAHMFTQTSRPESGRRESNSNHEGAASNASPSPPQSPFASPSLKLGSGLRSFLESISSGLSSPHATPSSSQDKQSESKTTSRNHEEINSGSVEEPSFSDDGRVEPLFGWLDSSQVPKA